MTGNVKFGMKIRLLREAKKVTNPAFSLRRFAEAVGLSPTFISKMENGQFDPPKPEKIKKMAELLSTDYHELLQLANRMDPDLAEEVKNQPHLVADFLRTVNDDSLTDEEKKTKTQELLNGHLSKSEGKK